MRIELQRYYGNKQVTKSYLKIYSEAGKLLFDGEAREGTFRNYSEKFRNCMSFCVAHGTDFRVDIGGTIYSPMTFKLVKIPGRLTCYLLFDPLSEQVYQHINVGYADAETAFARRKLRDVMKAKKVMTALAYEAFVIGEKVTCTVSNDNIVLDGIDMDSNIV